MPAAKYEYKVRPVVRYVVTSYYLGERDGCSALMGEFENEGYAESVATALREKQARFEREVRDEEMMKAEKDLERAKWERHIESNQLLRSAVTQTLGAGHD
jgi:hypothetical protein